MELLLRQDVADLGEMGEVVNVANGYARNYLLPRKLAVQVTEANLEMVRRARQARQLRDREELGRVKDVAVKLEGFLCFIPARATEQGHLYGSVGAEEVAEVLFNSGFDSIRPANIVMPRHFEELGDYDLEVMLHPEVRVHITVRVASLEEAEAGEEGES